MRIVIEATEEELRSRSHEILKAVAARLASYAEASAESPAPPAPPAPPARPRFTIPRDSLQKAQAGSLSEIHGARDSRAEARNTVAGVTGANILFGVMPRRQPCVDVGMDFLEQFIEMQQKVTPETLKQIAATKMDHLDALKPIQPPVRPYINPPERDEMDSAVRAEAPKIRGWLDQKLAQQRDMLAVTPGKFLGNDTSRAADWEGESGVF